MSLAHPENVVAAIVAGGKGSRLGGVIKPLVQLGSRRIIDRQAAALGQVFPRVMLVSADTHGLADVAKTCGLALVADRVPPGAGPLAGIDAALAALQEGETAVFCVAGDMPFLRPELLRFMRDDRPEARALAARAGRGVEPLFARYRRDAGPVVQARLAQGQWKAADLLVALQAAFVDEPSLRLVDPDLQSLININDPDDLQAALRLAHDNDRA